MEDNQLGGASSNDEALPPVKTDIRCDVITSILSLLIVVEAQRSGVDLAPVADAVSQLLLLVQTIVNQ